jgi:predicted nucleic acid-binding Zn finger protein
MAQLWELSQEAYDYLNNKPHTSWSQYTFPAPRFEHITSNIAEFVNSSWGEYRNFPTLQLFISSWTKVMSTFHLQRHRPHCSERATDYAKSKMDENYQRAHRYKVESAKEGLAQVYVPEGQTYVVDLKERTCTCGEFQEFLIPCQHTIAVCLWQATDQYDYLHEWFSLEYYRATYSHCIQPVQGEDIVAKWEECGPPIMVKQRGRPKKKRIRKEENRRRQDMCSFCGQKGHNRRNCRNGGT